MKFALSTLSTAVMTVMLMGLSVATSANTNMDNVESQNDVPPVTVTQIVDANDERQTGDATAVQTDTTLSVGDNTAINDPASTMHSQGIEQKGIEQQSRLATLIDPITHKAVDNSYPLEVSSFLSLEQAQNILLQVSPKLAANEAAIAAS
ncbi:MAG: hypothetical protein ACI9MD_002438, partial [Psychrobacter glaciei]